MSAMPSERILINSGPSKKGWHYFELMVRCPQLFAWTYRSDALAGQTKAQELVRGSIAHVGLAHYYKRLQAKQTRKDPEIYYAPAEAMDLVAKEFGATGAEMLPIAKRTVMEYLERHGVEALKVLHVEQEFTTILRDDKRGGRQCEFTMRPDLICEMADQVWCLDHKIVSALRSGVATRYTNSGQFLALRMLGRTLYGKRFGGAIINALQAAPNCKFERAPVGPSPCLLARFPTIILDVEDQIRALDAEKRPVDEWPAAASEHICKNNYGTLCPAFEICRFGVDG